MKEIITETLDNDVDNIVWYLLNIFVHKLLVELVSKTVVDKGGLFVVRLRSAAVLEYDVIVPPPFYLHVRLSLLGVFLLEKGVSREDVLHPNSLLFVSSLHLLKKTHIVLVKYRDIHCSLEK